MKLPLKHVRKEVDSQQLENASIQGYTETITFSHTGPHTPHKIADH